MAASKTTSSLTDGKRIVMCGTTSFTNSDNVKKTGIFFAVHNSIFNLTEYVYEDESTVSETCRDIQINENIGFITIISDYNQGGNIKIRGFSLESILSCNFRNGYGVDL